MKWLYGLLCLFFLIIFHEFGHFLAAKLFKVKVESFSVGFGPVLLHKKIRGTDYRLSLIPLGGYCGMKGEKDFKSAIEENLSEIHAEKDSLYGVHPLKRALIGFAGPFANFIFAFLAYSIIALTGYKYYTYSNKIILASELYENASMVAENAGLKSGDEIVKINKKNISDFSEIINEVATRPEEEIEVTVLRDKTYLSFKMTPELDKSSGSGKIGVAADSNSLIEKEAIRYGFFS
mgnify:CR=1 FL=1